VTVSKQLTREQKIERLRLLEEKKQRLLSKKPVYIPNAGQLPIHLSTKSERYCFSANGAGKSCALVNEVHWAATGYNPITKAYTKVPCKVVVVLDKGEKVNEVFLPEYSKWFDLKEDQKDKAGKPYVSRLHYDNGSVVSFYSAEASELSAEGFMADYVFVDEPCPKPLATALRRSLRIKGSPSKFTFMGTPISQPYLRTDVFEPWSRGALEHVECFRMGIDVNRANLADGYIERFSAGLNEQEKKVRLEGAFFDFSAMALASYLKPEHHVIPQTQFQYDYRMPCVVAVDCHAVKPHVAVMIATTRDDKHIVVKEMAFRGNATQFAEALKEWERGYNVVDRVCDSLGSQQGTAFEGMLSMIEGLNRNGVLIRPTTFKEKNHGDLIDRLRQGLAIPVEPDQFGQQIPKLRFLSTCRNTLTDIEQCTWQKNKATGELVEKLDTSSRDFLATLGYALAISPVYDIISHSKPRYKTEALPDSSPVKKSVERHREAVLRERAQRNRMRFMRRVTGT
jgi:phage-related protein